MSVNPVSLASLNLPLTAPLPSVSETGAAPFANLVDRILGGAAQSNMNADAAVRDLVMGRTDNLHGVLLQVAQADMSFRLILEIRNRLSEAYSDIMKMQI